MSNLGKKAIYKPEDLSLELHKYANASICWFAGPSFIFKQKFTNEFDLKITKQHLKLTPSLADTATNFYRLNRIIVQQKKNQVWSLAYVKIIQNILGALVGFKGFLRVRGVGYRFQIASKKLIISVGYSHNLEVKLPLHQNYTLNKKATLLRVKSHNLVLLSNFLSFVRNLRKPDVYKGKGIRYQKDLVKLKEGKKKKTA